MSNTPDADRFHSGESIGAARPRLRMFAAQGGVNCPVCDQLAKVYRRKVHATMAAALIAIFRLYGREWARISESGLTHRQLADFAKLSYWRLIEEQAIIRPDGGRAGVWRVTPTGASWASGLSTIQEYALVYNGGLLELEGDPVTIRDALGSKFNYDELMRGV